MVPKRCRAREVVGRLGDETYRGVHQMLPIACVDVIVERSGDEVLLLLRRDEPEVGRWYPPGGRIYRGETFFEASQRIVKSETGFTVRPFEVIDFDETFYDEAPFDHGKGTHTVNFIVRASCSGRRVGSAQYEVKWVSRNDLENVQNLPKRARLIVERVR